MAACYMRWRGAHGARRSRRAAAARSYAQRTPNAKVSSMHERRKSRSKVFALTIGWLLKRTLESGL